MTTMEDEMTSWRESISDEMREHGDSFDAVEACTLTEEELDIRFDAGYGGVEGLPFTVWTKERVYFPVGYDGAEWVGSVSRNPNSKPTEHFGGG